MESQLCPTGLQPFTVLESQRVESKSVKNAGKEMIKLKLNVQSGDGFDYHIYDYIAPWFMEHKFRHFFVAVNRLKVYEAGSLEDAASLVGAEGWCDVIHKKGKGEYGPAASISDYTVKSEKSSVEKPAKAKAESVLSKEDDDIPF